MLSFAIQEGSYSYELIQNAQECILAVPGEALAHETLECGLKSGRDIDKMREFHFSPLASQTVSVPGISECIANLECRIRTIISTGDHLTTIVEIGRFAVDRSNEQRNLLSVGPSHEGYDVLAKHGIHRIAAVKDAALLG
jgi:flavin reductase (DIM6/NTAB) family NADH-FMN oxidoreductase RutF